MSIQAWRDAKQKLAAAKEHLSLIGRTTNQSTLASREGVNSTAGYLHTLKVETQIHFQPYDGATNYHKSAYFDEALSEAVRRNWKALSSQAIEILEEKVRAQKAGARDALEALIAEIDNEAEGR